MENILKYLERTGGKRMGPVEMEVEQFLRDQGMKGIQAIPMAIDETIKQGCLLTGRDKIFDMTPFPGFFFHEGTWLLNDALPEGAKSVSLIGAACTHLGVPQDLVSRYMQEIEPSFLPE